MSGTLKESNPWAPDLDVTVDIENGATVDVRPAAFIDSADPIVTITQQPANGSTAPDGDGLIDVTLSQEGPDEARYTVEDTRGFVSAPAILRLEGVSQQPEPDPEPDPTGEPGSTGAATATVSNYPQLSAAIGSAGPGTIIQAANGNYGGNRLVVSNSGTAQNPIVVRAANILGANVPGGVRLAGQHIVWRGFDMTNTSEGGAPNPMVEIGGTGNQVWRCRVNCYRDQIRFLNGSGGRFMYNEMTNPAPNNHTQGNTHLLRGWYNNSTLHYDAEIGYNYIHDFPSKPAEAEYHSVRRFGVAAGSLFTYMFWNQNWHIHHNLLADLGSHRLVCYGSGNLFEFNTVSGEAITGSSASIDCNQRLGWNNVWRGNVSKNCRVAFHIHGGPNKIISHLVLGSGSGGNRMEVFAGNQAHDAVDEKQPRAHQVKLSGCNGPLIVGRSWGSYQNLPARETRVESHTGSVSLNGGNQVGTIYPASLTETLVTAFEITPAMVGPFGPNTAFDA